MRPSLEFRGSVLAPALRRRRADDFEERLSQGIRIGKSGKDIRFKGPRRDPGGPAGSGAGHHPATTVVDAGGAFDEALALKPLNGARHGLGFDARVASQLALGHRPAVEKV